MCGIFACRQARGVRPGVQGPGYRQDDRELRQPEREDLQEDRDCRLRPACLSVDIIS